MYYFLVLAPESEREVMRQYFRDLNAKGAKADQARIAIADWNPFEVKWKAAILALEPVCENVVEHLAVAAGYRDDRQYANAITSYEAALKLDPKAPGVHYWLGFCHKRNGDYELARPPLLEALESDAKDPRPAYQLARIESGLDKKDSERDLAKAVELARQALERAGGEDAFYMSFLARCLALAGDHKAAIATSKKALKLADEESKPGYEQALDELEAAAKKK